MAYQGDLRLTAWIEVDARKARLTASNMEANVLQRCDLSEADLSGSSLRGAAFLDCTLKKTTWKGAEITSATFIGCDLSGSDFVGADLEWTTLYDCDLSFVSFWRCGLKDTHLYSCHGPALYLRSDLELLREVSGGRLRAYRWETPEGAWRSPPYEVGKTYHAALNRNRRLGCAPGIHAATLDWCIDIAMRETHWNGTGEAPFRILEVSASPAEVIVPFTRARLRCSDLTVERIVPQEEWLHSLETSDEATP
jgi:hypothetical protein